jgi:hypothetical protein
MLKFKWGIARLIMESKKPIVIPFYHHGMAEMFPIRFYKGLKYGKKIRVIFGDPIEFQDDFTFGLDASEARIKITKLCQTKLEHLKKEVETENCK